MKLLTGEAQRGPLISSVIVLASLTVLTLTVVTYSTVKVAAPVLAIVVLLAVAHKQLLAWRTLLGLTIAIILFIPIRRYSLPASLPIQLEPYRVMVALVATVWVTALLIDPRVRLRRSGLEVPIAVFLLAILGSLLANPKRVEETNSFVVKGVTFFLSFVIVFFLVVSLARKAREIDFLTRLLAGGGAILALSAIVESRTHYNVWNHLQGVVPILDFKSGAAENLGDLRRGGRLRVYASAQHPIALGAALAMLIPLALYRAQAFRQKRWWLITVALLMGVLATRSRTAIMMLAAIALVYLLLRPTQVKRFWPALLPALIAIHLVLPGTLGSLRNSFFPAGGLIAQQTEQKVGSGRLATLGPALDKEFKPNPILGEGYSTRITHAEPNFPRPNAPITDDGWLSILLETGLVGAVALVWLFFRALRRMGGTAKRDFSPRGWFLTAITASVAAFGVGMFTYDAFSFIQVTFLLFIVLGIGMAALRTSQFEWHSLAAKQPASGGP